MKKATIRPVLLVPALFLALLLLPRAEAGTDWKYTNRTAESGGTTYPNIDNDWNGGSVTINVDNAANRAAWVARNIKTGTVSNLTISSSALGGASLTIGSSMTLTDNSSVEGWDPNTLIVSGSVNLTGHYVTSGNTTTFGRAELIVQDGKTVSVSGGLNMNAASRLTVGGGSGTDSSYFLTNNFAQKGKHSEVNIEDRGFFLSVNASSIEEGTFTVNTDSTALFRDTLTVGGSEDPDSKAELNLAGGALVLSQGLDEDGERLTDPESVILSIKKGGTLRASSGDSTIGDATYTGMSRVENTGGHLIVDSGAILTAETVVVSSNYSTTAHEKGTEILGTLNATNFESLIGGTTLVTGTLNASTLFKLSGGTVDIAAGGTVSGPSLGVSGGTLNVSGLVTGSGGALAVSGGTVNVESGGAVALKTITVTGENTRFHVKGGASLVGETPGELDFSVSSGIATFAAGSDIGGGRNGDGLSSLAVTTNGTLNLGTGVLTKSLAVSGTLNLHTGGALEVEHDDTATGAMKLTGDIYLSGGSLHLHNDVDFSAKTVFGTVDGGFIDLGPEAGGTSNYKLTVSKAGTFDASGGNIVVQNAGSVFIDGTYLAGHNGTDATMLKVSGMSGGGSFTMGSNAQIYLSRALQQVINSQDLTVGDGYRILDTDATYVNGVIEPFEIFDQTTLMYYTFEYKDDGGYGLHVTGARELTREEQKKLIVNAWRAHPKIGKYVDNVLRPDFLEAIVDGNRIAIGFTGDYDSLSSSGKFNANVLSSLTSLGTSDYDSLMLYNGSGLAMANRALVNANQQTLKRLSLRNNFIRREITLSGDVCDPCMDPDWQEPEPGPANRFWAIGTYSSDASGADEGFAGYDFTGKGVLLGYDRLIGNLAIGGAFAYTGGDFKDKAALGNDSTIDTYGALLYGNYQSERGLFVSGTIGYAFSDNEIRDRRVLDGNLGWNYADYRSYSLLASIGLGIDIPLGDYLILTPSTGFTYVGTRSNSHTQLFSADDGSANANTLSAGRVKDHSSALPIDLGISYELYGDDESLFVLIGNVGYAYEMNNKGASGTISYSGLSGVGPVGIASRRPGRHVLNLGANMKYLYRQYELGFGYDYVGRKKYNSHSFTASAGIVF